MNRNRSKRGLTLSVNKHSSHFVRKLVIYTDGNVSVHICARVNELIRHL